ncbi:MAG: type III pantothenate kinase [Gammaproteobacteria bacterium]|nr:type III pantothenate kinase [Gammaproteobacteria bacterium]
MLLIDVGNSCLKWAVWNKNNYQSEGTEFYSKEKIIQVFEKLLPVIDKESVVYISSVAGKKINKDIECWFYEFMNLEVVFLTVESEFKGLKNGYVKTNTLGVDRWLAMIGAWQKYQAGCCVIDCGTAVTMDVINNNGQHLGGVIMPGVGLMCSSLRDGTDAIDVFQGELNSLARSTEDAVTGGCFYVLAEGLNGLIKKYQSEINTDLLCIITGGNGREIAKQFSCKYFYEPRLVMDGICAVVLTEN